MGYESKVYLVSRYDFNMGKSGELILTMNMGKIDDELLGLLKEKKLDFYFSVGSNDAQYKTINKLEDAIENLLKSVGISLNNPIRLSEQIIESDCSKQTDPYGDSYTYTDNLEAVIDFLEKNRLDYRRYETLYHILSNYRDYGDNVVLVHSGF